MQWRELEWSDLLHLPVLLLVHELPAGHVHPLKFTSREVVHGIASFISHILRLEGVQDIWLCTLSQYLAWSISCSWWSSMAMQVKNLEWHGNEQLFSLPYEVRTYNDNLCMPLQICITGPTFLQHSNHPFQPF